MLNSTAAKGSKLVVPSTTTLSCCSVIYNNAMGPVGRWPKPIYNSAGLPWGSAGAMLGQFWGSKSPAGPAVQYPCATLGNGNSGRETTGCCVLLTDRLGLPVLSLQLAPLLQLCRTMLVAQMAAPARPLS